MTEARISRKTLKLMVKNLKQALKAMPRPVRFMKARSPAGGMTIVGLGKDDEVLSVIHPGYFSEEQIEEMEVFEGRLP